MHGQDARATLQSMSSLRLVQLGARNQGRRVALVEEPKLRLLSRYESIYDLAQEAIARETRLANIIHDSLTDEKLDYDPIYPGRSEWKLLRAFDHPRAASRCLVTGTGLTHRASAENRQSMHETGIESDSMKMYRMGVE